MKTMEDIQDERNSAEALAHAEMREDNAIQRQVLDMKAAGINPVLASNFGGGASSAAAIKYVDSAATTTMASSAEKNANANLINAITNMITSAMKLSQK